MNTNLATNQQVTGDFVTLNEERFYAIRNVDQMAPFFISVVSDSDHWLFVSSTGSLTAGRVSPETALFPYANVDKIYESDLNTGCKTLVRGEHKGSKFTWEPFNREHAHRYQVTRNLYKNVLGNKLCFEEINHDLQLAYRYTWATSEEYGFVRQCEIENLSDAAANVEVLDGFQNILPAGTPRYTQANSSNLVDAYKWTELDESTGLVLFTLYSGITDRAEPCESLKTNTVFCLGLDNAKTLVSSEQVEAFKAGATLVQEPYKRGIRGAYFANATLELAGKATQKWQFAANIEQTQNQAVALRRELADKAAMAKALETSVAKGCDELARIMAGADGFQVTGEENVSVHHYANVLFNVLRGGAFDDQYQISSKDFADTIALFNKTVFERNKALFDGLAEKVNYAELVAMVEAAGDDQLTRLAAEYLPICFGRRHGDPSRPWNQFAIKLKDDEGNRLLTYQGNWRDIFQNWEALTFSYPEFVESVIAKFVNASTVDGYNPYRITKEGIDWEVEDPEDPWSYIGYWGDHQIIYLQKMLELSRQFHPEKLTGLLRQPIFSYANVPYRIKGFDDLVKDAKDTVMYDEALAEVIEQRVASMGADGKMVLNSDGDVYQVNLLEKLLVPLLSKLGNLVVDGGIWLNTQRPEWNDANNALVGQGLSMVTLNYLRRYICFFQELLAAESEDFTLSTEVAQWLTDTAKVLAGLAPKLDGKPVSQDLRFEVIEALGRASADYRDAVYKQVGFSSQVAKSVADLQAMLKDALVAIEHTITTSKREDELYNAYNLLSLDGDKSSVETLYPMLEGQVAALSSGALSAEETIKVLESLFASDVYREDQDTFMLYPDRKQPSFLDTNVAPSAQVEAIELLVQMLAAKDARLISQDVEGNYRFSADLRNAGDVNNVLDKLVAQYGDAVASARKAVLDLYEGVFNHQEFTGRSGGMFGFEGLGSIYWHMVSKLLLAVEENFFNAVDTDASEEQILQLAKLYYRVRDGIGFNKTPESYGAFPTDPYSHTPKHNGAQQPGMTGQVKEEVLTRFGELGLRVDKGLVSFTPNLLQSCEFIEEATPFTYLDVDNNWQTITVPAKGLGYTWCQVPIVYQIDEAKAPSLTITYANGEEKTVTEFTLSGQDSQDLFLRNGNIKQITLALASRHLYH